MSAAHLLADLRYGFRQLRLNPGFACLAILTLALGIGANTALFSVVRNVILKPLPYRDPEQIVRVWMDNRRLQMREDWASYLNYQDRPPFPRPIRSKPPSTACLPDSST